METLKDTDWAYAAGVMDSDGCFGLYLKPKKNAFVVELSVTNTNLTILTWLQNHFGGKVNVFKQYRAGTKLPEGTIGRWQLHRKEQQLAFLRGILPYLTNKIREAEIALEVKTILLNRDWIRERPPETTDRLMALMLESRSFKGKNRYGPSPHPQRLSEKATP